MKYTKEKFLKQLGVENLHETFFDMYEQTMEEYDTDGVFFLEDDFVSRLQSEYGFLNDKYDFVMRELRRVRECELAAKYSFLLYKMLLRNTGKPKITLAERPSFASVDATVDFEMAAYFSELAFAPEMIEYYEKKHLPKKIISDTLRDCFEGTIQLRQVTHDRDGFDDKTYFFWNQFYIDHSIIRVGVLNFEINAKLNFDAIYLTNGKGEYKILPRALNIAEGGYVAGSAGHPDTLFVADCSSGEDFYEGYPINLGAGVAGFERERLNKSEWREAIKKGDGVISVHIPTGAAITPENCTAAYRECLEIVREYFPEYDAKAFYCHSWLLSPTHATMLRETSNIVTFGSRFLRFPSLSMGKSVFSFLFRRPFNSYEDLPENTSLERAVKTHYLEGKFIYETAGLIFEDML